MMSFLGFGPHYHATSIILYVFFAPVGAARAKNKVRNTASIRCTTASIEGQCYENMRSYKKCH